VVVVVTAIVTVTGINEYLKGIEKKLHPQDAVFFWFCLNCNK
jgi:AICAR transformylase/IMP cyclohydrolase PurH